MSHAEALACLHSAVAEAERDWLVERFERERPRLRAVAYRLLGSVADADDAVQEASFRLNRTEASKLENVSGWLTTGVARISLNILRVRRTRRRSHSSLISRSL